MFVRLTTCSARCTWRDTPHAFREGSLRTLADVLGQVLALDTPLVELTGGEPLLQAEAFALMIALADAGKTVLLSSVFGRVSPRELAEWLLESRLNVRMQFQLHKFIWAPDARGV